MTIKEAKKLAKETMGRYPRCGYEVRIKMEEKEEKLYNEEKGVSYWTTIRYEYYLEHSCSGFKVKTYAIVL